jgi:hypothetical protein
MRTRVAGLEDWRNWLSVEVYGSVERVRENEEATTFAVDLLVAG